MVQDELPTAAQMTDIKSNQNRESIGQGIANIASGFLGGMDGCAMVGQSVINLKSGGRRRLAAGTDHRHIRA